MRLTIPSKPNHALLMGILNVTPDSFSDGGQFNTVGRALARTEEMLQEGADIIDIGGESTRPGALEISTDAELSRVIPVITAIRKRCGDQFPISIDTYKATVARQAMISGATMVNSMGGLRFDPDMGTVIAASDCPFIMYHVNGTPRTMQTETIIYRDIIGDIQAFFEEQIAEGSKKGIKRDRFIIDPGIGFGKTVAQNLEIIRRLAEFQTLRLPVQIGVSRKSHLGMLLQQKLKLKNTPAPRERLEASLAETAVAVQHGARIVRTHDVQATKKFLLTLEEL
jgi:dihydropteroate synthase